MVEGKIKKYISEVTLLNQPFVKDNDIKISDLLDKNDNKIYHFIEWKLEKELRKG